jgi:hypothetical protein
LVNFKIYHALKAQEWTAELFFLHIFAFYKW